jgi:response regulator of citrate/malate metabolism
MAKKPTPKRRKTKALPPPEKRKAVTTKRLQIKSVKSKRPYPVRAREEPATQLPTATQMAALEAFAKLCDELGRDPSVRELSARLGLSALGAQQHLVQLTLKGCLEEEKELVTVGRKLTPLGKKWLAMPR